MLDLVRPYVGGPAAAPATLVLAHRALLLYPTADSVAALDASSLSLVRVLAFSDVFPSSQHASSSISALAVDPAFRLILAAAAHRLAVWSLSDAEQDSWRVHSFLTLPKGTHVTAIDCRAGLLTLAYTDTLAVYSLVLEDDLPTWSRKWSSTVPTPSHVCFSPSLVYIATASQTDLIVRIHLTTSGRSTQSIPHPRPITGLEWRQPQPNSRDNLILYTFTRDDTLRVFMPVIDAPHYLQLHATLDLHSCFPGSPVTLTSKIFRLDRQVLADVLHSILQSSPDLEDAKTRRARDIKDEGWDLFLRVLSDGSLIIKAIANIDRRPPTLLKHFTLLETSTPLSKVPTFLMLLPDCTESERLTLVASSPLSSFILSPLEFFDARDDGLLLSSRLDADKSYNNAQILRFVRTPEGCGVAVERTNGGESWQVLEQGTRLERCRSWGQADNIVLLEQGRTFVTYSSKDGQLTLHSGSTCTLQVPQLESLFTLPASSPGNHACIYGLTKAPVSILHIHATAESTLVMQSHTALPVNEPLLMIVQVDPMAWSRGGAGVGVIHDVLLSVSNSGDLNFWIPEEDHRTVATLDTSDIAARRRTGWKKTGTLRTGRQRITRVRCSSAKKTALVAQDVGGEEITIWDSKESQFASGLEYRVSLQASDAVCDLDWTATPDAQSILAVGFARRIDILCQQRATYFDEDPGWVVIRQINLEGLVPRPISDSIWLANGSFLVGAGHQMLLYGFTSSKNKKTERDAHLFETVARRNGPLADFHPQMVLQCLLWEKLELVKEIIVNLAGDLERLNSNGGDLTNFDWTSVPISHFLRDRRSSTEGSGQNQREYHSLFQLNGHNQPEEGFSRTLVERLMELLELYPLPYLTPNEHASLLVLIQATLEVDESRRALDPNGLRYLILMRSFYILNKRATSPSSPTHTDNGTVARKSGWRARLRYRDIVWAFHSESQGLLLNLCSMACQNKMTWSDARALGVFMWLNSVDAMKQQFESVARNEYMSGDIRDPVSCSIFYFALGKHKLVHGLWRQAAWHKEQHAMLKFLNNDFNQPRWRTAASKNAFALLSKQRFEYAAAFFLLAGSLKDAVNVCVRNLDDNQLAVAIARIVEGGDEGPILKMVLETRVIPEAFRTGNRYLASWAFWLLHKRDLVVRILVTPLSDIARILPVSLVDIGSPHYDDPSLALLFSQLKAKTLQTAKGTSEISGRFEFDFVLQTARVFVRMGCHVLALDLLRSWSFDRPSTIVRDTMQPLSPPSPLASRFALEPALRRRASIMIDMDISTAPPTRRASPTRGGELQVVHEDSGAAFQTESTKENDSDLVSRKAGIGSLMKTARKDVQVPEFDMSSFF